MKHGNRGTDTQWNRGMQRNTSTDEDNIQSRQVEQRSLVEQRYKDEHKISNNKYKGTEVYTVAQRNKDSQEHIVERNGTQTHRNRGPE